MPFLAPLLPPSPPLPSRGKAVDLAAAGDSARPTAPLPPPWDIAAFPRLNASGIASLRGVLRALSPPPPPPPDQPPLGLLLPAGEAAEKCLGVLLAEPEIEADRGRMLGVAPPPAGVNPSERRTVPAEGEREGSAGAMAWEAAARSLGLDSTCHRSDVAPGRASRGAMSMEAYLGRRKDEPGGRFRLSLSCRWWKVSKVRRNKAFSAYTLHVRACSLGCSRKETHRSYRSGVPAHVPQVATNMSMKKNWLTRAGRRARASQTATPPPSGSAPAWRRCCTGAAGRVWRRRATARRRRDRPTWPTCSGRTREKRKQPRRQPDVVRGTTRSIVRAT